MAIAFALAVGVRLLFALGYWVGKPFTLDEQEYLTLGENLARGLGFVYDDTGGREHFGRAPGYPVFLGAVFAFGGGLTTVKVAQSVVGAGATLLVARLAGLFAGASAEIAAAFVAALYPPLVWICAYALSEALYSAFTLGAACLLWQALRAGDTAAARAVYFAAGIVTGLAVLTRPAALFFVALSALYLTLRRSVRSAAALVLGAVLVILPWATFKTHQAGRLVIVASEGGVTFWTGNHPRSIGEGDMAANPEIRKANDELRSAHPGVSPDELEPIYYREAARFILEHPLAWMRLLMRKLFFLWVPVGPSYTLHSDRYYRASLVSYLGILPFALAGCWRSARRTEQPIPLWLLGGSVVLTSLVFSPQERFRIPVLDPVMIIFASSLVGRQHEVQST